MIGGNPKKKNKWGAYESEKEAFDWARTGFAFGNLTKSLEAEVMDWADDITFAVHDVVDFYCAGKIPLDRLGSRNETELGTFYDAVFSREGNEDLKERQGELKGLFEGYVCEVFGSIEGPFTGASEQKSALWQRMTTLISRYVQAITVAKAPNGKLVTLDKDCENEIAMLKQLTWHYVILDTDLATNQHGQRHLVRSVFKTLYEGSRTRGGYKFLPPFYEELLRESKTPCDRLRIVADYVSSMTETEIITVYGKLSGTRTLSTR